MPKVKQLLTFLKPCGEKDDHVIERLKSFNRVNSRHVSSM